MIKKNKWKIKIKQSKNQWTGNKKEEREKDRRERKLGNYYRKGEVKDRK